MRELTFYTKPDCPLCVESYAKVARIARRRGLGVKRVNIETEPRLLALHRYRIPVVELEGRELTWGRVSEKALEKKLAELLEA